MAAVERREAGAVLAFVILIMLGLLALAHGVLVASLSEMAGSRAAVRDLEVRAAAEYGLQAALKGMPGSWMDSLDVWDSRTEDHGMVGRVDTRGTLRRLGPESWLVEGAGRIDDAAEAHTAALAWSLDPLVRVTSLPGIVSVRMGAPTTIGGTVDSSAPAAVTVPMRAGDCDPWLDTLDAHFLAVSAPLVASPPDTSGFPSLGLLDFDGLMALAGITVAGSGTPTPTESAGACVTDDPWGWGDPDRPWRPCGSHLPFRASAGDLTMNGGVGQGILVVDGEATLENGARYFGLVITRGAFRLEGGAAFEGMALAGGGLFVASSAVLRGSACWAVRVLQEQRQALGRLIPVEAAGRVGPV